MKRLPPLNALRAFDAAVHTGSFTRAGEALHVTQGAISRQIKQLETWLGKALFVRHHQGLVLTAAGSLLAKSLDSAFGTLHSAVEELTQLGERQRIAINVPPTFASRWLAPRLRSFHGLHPDIDLSITTNDVTSVREARQYDGLVMFLAEPWAKFNCRLLRQEHYIAVASPELWRDGAPPGLGAATLLHVLNGTRRMPMWENWLASLGVREVDPGPGIAFSTMDQAINAAVSGAGVAVVDAAMVQAELSDHKLRRLDAHELVGHFGYWFVNPHERDSGEHAQRAVVGLFQAWLMDMSKTPLALSRPVAPTPKRPRPGPPAHSPPT